MTADTLAERLRNHVSPSRAEMAAYADEVDDLRTRVEALADEYDLTGSPRLIDASVIVTDLRAALDGAP